MTQSLLSIAALIWLAAAPGQPAGTPRQAAPPSGTAAIGDYRFGMTRDDVRRVASCAPYQEVAGTRGLECPNYSLEGRTMNISFVFTGDALTRIQLWFYEGPSETAAREATSRMIAYLSGRGAIRSNELPGGSAVTAEALFSSLRERNRLQQGARVQVLTGSSKPPFVHGSITHAITGYYVFVFLRASADA